MTSARHATVSIVRAVALAASLLVCSGAQASGPMTHMMDGQYYLDLVSIQGPLDQAEDVRLIDDTNTERYFLMGTMFPDLGSAIDGLGFSSHDRALAIALLDAAEPYRDTHPWKVAFARGYIQHICTDISAQLFQTQAMNIASGLGEVDLFDGMDDDHPGAEDELLVEAGIDLFYGDVDLLLDILDYFVLDPFQHDARLQQVVDFWWETAEALYGAGIISQADLEDQIDEYVHLVTKYQVLIRENLIDLLFLRLRRQSLGDLLEDWMTKADRYLSRQPDAPMQMDLDELHRLEDTPMFSDRRYLSWYFDDFQWLGPTIHQHFDTGDLWYREWPTWDGQIMRATGIQGLAMAWPERFDGSWEVIVSSARFVDAASGHALGSLSQGNLPGTVLAQVEVYATVPVDTWIRVRVMRDLPGGYTADEVCGDLETSERIELDPAEYHVVPRPVLEIAFDPAECVPGADGIYLEAVLGDVEGGKPFYTANWEAFEGIPGRDITQAPYRNLYAPPDQRPGYVVVTP